MRILIADSQTKVRFALRVLLERQPGFEVVGRGGERRRAAWPHGRGSLSLIWCCWTGTSAGAAGGPPAPDALRHDCPGVRDHRPQRETRGARGSPCRRRRRFCQQRESTRGPTGGYHLTAARAARRRPPKRSLRADVPADGAVLDALIALVRSDGPDGGSNACTSQSCLTVETAASERGNRSWARRGGLFALFLVCGLAVFALGVDYHTRFWTNSSGAFKVGVPAVFLVAMLALRRSERGPVLLARGLLLSLLPLR
jgi:hypothetical protein